MSKLYFLAESDDRFSACDGSFFVIVTFHGQPLVVPFFAFESDLFHAEDNEFAYDSEVVLDHEYDDEFMEAMMRCIRGDIPLEEVPHHATYLDTDDLEYQQDDFEDLLEVRNVRDAFLLMSTNYRSKINKERSRFSPGHPLFSNYEQSVPKIIAHIQEALLPYFPHLCGPSLNPSSPSTFL